MTRNPMAIERRTLMLFGFFYINRISSFLDWLFVGRLGLMMGFFLGQRSGMRSHGKRFFMIEILLVFLQSIDMVCGNVECCFISPHNCCLLFK